MTRNAVTYKINKVVHYYYKHVIVFSHWKASKNKNQEDKRAEKSFNLHVE